MRARAWIGLILFMPACGGAPEEPAPGAAAEPEPDACNPPDPVMAPSASFAEDIAPLWAASCTGNLCHAGPNDTTLDAFLDDWVGAVGFATKEMPLITPFEPEQSFLMHKLDGTQSCLDLACNLIDCGGVMPLGGPLLDAEDRAKFRRWIDDGATAP